MILIEPKVEIIPQRSTLLGVYQQIEAAGRTCYKSEDKITPDSCEEFVQRMINNGHTAMLEHGTVYLKVPADVEKVDFDAIWELANNKFTKTNYETSSEYNYITTNLRVLVENDWLKALKYICEPTEFHEKRITVRFTCDRGVSHELVRHRVFSFAQESTRFCNYSKDKFGNQLTYIIPSWMELNPGEYSIERDSAGHRNIIGDGYYYDMSDGISEEPAFLYGLLTAETSYFTMLHLGWTPQQARQLLPNALKTEVVMTGFVKDWEHFFELRCVKNAHPDMQLLANQLKEKFKMVGIL